MSSSRSLERKMLSYFGLIAAASIFVSVEFILATRALSSSGDAAGGAQAALPGLEVLRNKAVLMCVVQALVTLIVLIMFMRRITGPLQEMVEQSRFISEGDLSRTIPVRSGDEIGLLAQTINGLTSNIQEIVAIGLAAEASLRRPMEELRERLVGDEAGAGRLAAMETELNHFSEVLNSFKLFPPPVTTGEERPW